MNKTQQFVEIMAIVEGKTEKIFINLILKPYLAKKNIAISATILSKPGQKGGDVRFARAKNELNKHLRQRNDTYITLFFDYYGIKEWPEYQISKSKTKHTEKVQHLCDATLTDLKNSNANFNEIRFIPYFSMFEFEALLFSEPNILASEINLKNSDAITKILREFKNEPEQINDSPITAPSKRLKNLSNRFKKTSTGITVAKKIGISKIRQECPLFNQWLSKLEELQPLNA